MKKAPGRRLVADAKDARARPLFARWSIQLARQRYVDDPDIREGIAAPSVITINDMGTGWAANDLMQFLTGLGRPASGYRLLRTNPVNDAAPHVTIQVPYAEPACHVCGAGANAVCSAGDGRELPTRERPRRPSFRSR